MSEIRRKVYDTLDQIEVRAMSEMVKELEGHYLIGLEGCYV